MPGDPRVLAKRVVVTFAVAVAVVLLVPILGAFAGVDLRSAWIVIFAPFIVGIVTPVVWWNRSRTISRRIVAQLIEGDPPPPEASELMRELGEICSLIDIPGFWRPSMRYARWGTGARCRELAAEAGRFGLDEMEDRLLVLGDALASVTFDTDDHF